MGLLIAEVALRVAGFTYFSPYMVDTDLGYALRPGAEGWWRKEGVTYIKINSHGFRDREHPVAKPANTFRIAVLGDSYAEALQVPLAKTFWSVMQQALQGCPQVAGSTVEALNFGVSGFSTTRELILLRQRVWQYSPDAVVLLITTGNDIRDNSPTLSKYSRQPQPFFVFRDGELVLDDALLAARNRSLRFRLQRSFVGTSFDSVRSHLRLLGLIYTAREAHQSSRPTSARPSDRQQQQRAEVGSPGEPGSDTNVYREPVDADWIDAWRLTERLIVRLHAEVRAEGVEFLAVTGSNGIQVNPDPAVRREFMNRLGIGNLFYPDQRLKALGAQEGFRVLNLAPPLAEYASRHHVFLHSAGETEGRGHWNEIGHRLTGQLIARELCQVITAPLGVAALGGVTDPDLATKEAKHHGRS